MSLANYIKGERYGKKAHELEKEAMHDPFLQDAIDGYDLEDDLPSYHLKRLKSQVKKRTRNNSHYPELWSIVSAVLLIMGLSVFFFLYDRDNKTVFPNDTTLVADHPVDSTKMDHIIDSLTALKSTSPVIDVPSNSEITEKSPDQKGKRKITEAYEEFDWYPNSDEPNDYTLSNSEIQEILSVYPGNEEDMNVSVNLNQQPRPAGGEKAYNDYITKNRNFLTDDANEEHGKVILLFSVDENGRPVDIIVLRPLSRAADREAVRLLQNGPNWTVGSQNVHLEIDF